MGQEKHQSTKKNNIRRHQTSQHFICFMVQNCQDRGSLDLDLQIWWSPLNVKTAPEPLPWASRPTCGPLQTPFNSSGGRPNNISMWETPNRMKISCLCLFFGYHGPLSFNLSVPFRPLMEFYIIYFNVLSNYLKLSAFSRLLFSLRWEHRRALAQQRRAVAHRTAQRWPETGGAALQTPGQTGQPQGHQGIHLWILAVFSWVSNHGLTMSGRKPQTFREWLYLLWGNFHPTVVVWVRVYN